VHPVKKALLVGDLRLLLVLGLVLFVRPWYLIFFFAPILVLYPAYRTLLPRGQKSAGKIVLIVAVVLQALALVVYKLYFAAD